MVLLSLSPVGSRRMRYDGDYSTTHLDGHTPIWSLRCLSRVSPGCKAVIKELKLETLAGWWVPQCDRDVALNTLLKHHPMSEEEVEEFEATLDESHEEVFGVPSPNRVNRKLAGEFAAATPVGTNPRRVRSLL